MLNETIVMNLKYWSDDTKTWFPHAVDHVAQYSVSCVVRSKRKEFILKKIFKNWVSVFGCPKKIWLITGIKLRITVS